MCAEQEQSCNTRHFRYRGNSNKWLLVCALCRPNVVSTTLRAQQKSFTVVPHIVHPSPALWMSVSPAKCHSLTACISYRMFCNSAWIPASKHFWPAWPFLNCSWKETASEMYNCRQWKGWSRKSAPAPPREAICCKVALLSQCQCKC